MPSAYGNIDFNLAILYINGKKNREFSYATNDYFAQSSPITIGSDYADVDVYGIRMYDMALTSQQVLKNYINCLVDNSEKEQVNTENDVLDITGTEVDYSNTVDQYNVMVFDNDLPSFLDPNEKKGALEVYFYEHPKLNVSISNVKASGQGTSSKKYFRWNTKYKLDKDKSVITYADGTTSIGQWQMTDGIPAASVFTAKKNFASSMQSHKMGSVNSVDLLYKELGLTNEAMELDSTKRISVYQMPFIMFTKSINEEGDTVYKFEGEYTFGADKGDENTFGYDTDTFPKLISLDGSDNSPLPALFRVPWSSRMQYNKDEEAFQYNGQNCWDFGGGKVENINLWIPAYNLAYECSNRILPFEGTLEELNADVLTYRSSGYDYWIAKEGDTNQYNQYYYESSEGRFIGADVGNGTINLLAQLQDYIDTGNVVNMNNQQKNELFINARVAKFRDEAPAYFDITDAIFHRNWIEVHAGTDQRAKNTYPYSFGGKWKWRFDDMDTIFDTDNQGQPLKKYSVEVQDEGVWNGQTSNFWNLIDLAYPEEIQNEMIAFLDAMETLGGLNVGDDYGKLFAYFKKFYLDSSQYFPATVVNSDTKYCYETAKLNNQYVNDTDPMTQALGDHYSAESAWISKRINYIMSKYSYGNFSAHGNDTIIVRAAGDLINYHLTPAIDLYPNIANGTSIVRGNRTFAGETAVMTIDLGGSADQQNIIQGASWYSSIGDWHDKNVKGTMTIQGKRLQELILGSKTDDVTIKIDALDIKPTCKSLQTILLSNISTLKGNLDLSECTHLRELYADGTALSQIILPKGSLQHIEYPDTSQYISLQYFPLLEYNDVLLGNSITNITDMIVTSSPLVQPVKLLSDILEAQDETNHNLKHIRLTDFDEEFDKTDGAKVLDNLARITDGTYTGLDLDVIELEGCYPVLEGTITLNCNCYEDSVESLRQKFTKLNLTVNGAYYFRFKDEAVQQVIAQNWGDGIGIERKKFNTITSFNNKFQGNTNIQSFKELSLFTGLTKLESRAFYGDAALTEIALDNVIDLGSNAFYGCKSLIDVGNISKVQNFGSQAFYNCSSLTGISDLSNAVTIGAGAFRNCTSLEFEDLAMPNLTSLGQVAFENVSIKRISDLGKITQLPAGSGSKNYGKVDILELVIIPDGITTIPNYSFQSYKVLKQVILPESITSVGRSAFSGCSSLSNINLKNVTTLGSSAFYSATSLTEVKLPSIITIEESALSECTGITKMDLPATIQSIGNSVFYGCSALKTFICRATTPPTIYAYTLPTTLTTIYVPDESVDLYKSASNWSKFSTKIKPLSEYSE